MPALTPLDLTKLIKWYIVSILFMKDYMEIAADWYLHRMDNAPAAIQQNSEISRIYEECRAKIEEVLADTEYFHGSGSHQYVKGKEKPVEKLSPILKEGLVPHDDLLSKPFVGRKIPSVSVCQQRPYSRVYADLNMPKGQNLAYEYGSRRFWWWYFLAKMGMALLKNPQERKFAVNNWWNLSVSKLFIQRSLSPKLSNVKNTWNYLVYKLLAEHPAWNDILKPKEQEPKQDFEEESTAWLDRYTGHKADGSKDPMWKIKLRTALLNKKSSITDNVPLIFGIRKNAVKPIELKNKAVARYEVRTDKTVTPDKFTYIEAPLEKITGVRRRLIEAGLDIPVFPMECMELHMRTRPFHELTSQHAI